MQPHRWKYFNVKLLMSFTIKLLNQRGKNFSNCIYCDVKMDTYRTLRASTDFFLAADGSYSGAAEQILEGKVERTDRSRIQQSLAISHLSEKMRTKDDVIELQKEVMREASTRELVLV